MKGNSTDISLQSLFTDLSKHHCMCEVEKKTFSVVVKLSQCLLTQILDVLVMQVSNLDKKQHVWLTVLLTPGTINLAN